MTHEEMRKTLLNLAEQKAELERKLEIAKKALEFYSSCNHIADAWDVNNDLIEVPGFTLSSTNNIVECGVVAKAALKGIK